MASGPDRPHQFHASVVSSRSALLLRGQSSCLDRPSAGGCFGRWVSRKPPVRPFRWCRGGARRPHLVTAAAVRMDVSDPGVRAEYLVALWLLTCVMAAIDRRTIQAGRVGLVLDGGIALSVRELAHLDFKRGRKREGYRGDYYTLPA